jgi:Fic-DOC domain mobile mystery protein B
MRLFTYPEGAMPLDPDEIDGLIPSHIVNRGQLNELEQQNIVDAELWLVTARLGNINNETRLRKLHKMMFGQVWQWAGTFRQTGKNIGVEAYQISMELRNLCEDVNTWLEFESYPPDEIAARFHHRLVYIHLFPNGNGRHARLAADILLMKTLNQPRFSWGQGIIEHEGGVRKQYIRALREADRGNYQPLLDFVRS